MARLIVVSNRVSIPGDETKRAGGLEVALRPALQQNGGVWLGWSGKIAPGDELVVSVGVFNNTVFKPVNGGTAPPIQLEVQVSGGLTAQSPTRVDLQIPDKKEGVAEFRFKTNPVLALDLVQP